MNPPRENRFTILVVDDEKNYRIVLARLFGNVGYRVLLAESAVTAMSMLQQETVSLILTDQHMSGQNGLDFCEQVRREIGSIPCILFTANAARIPREQMLRCGVAGCLNKPFDNRLILKMVAETLSGLSEAGSQTSPDCAAAAPVANLNYEP